MKLTTGFEVRPYFSDDDSALVCGDVLETLRLLPDESIDLVVTSPPYNIGKEYENVRPLEAYLSWCESWINELHRILKPTGGFWLNLGYLSIPGQAKAIPIPYLLWNRIPFFLVQEIVWNYGAGVAGRRFFSPRNEKFLWYVKNPDHYTFNLDAVRDPNVKYPNQRKHGKLRVNPLGKNPTDVWRFPKVTSGAKRSSKERTSHPAQFPEAVIHRIVRVSSHDGDVVLDPFAGAGTTLVVSKKDNRRSLGIEIREDYCALAASRLMATTRVLAADRAQAILPL